MSKLLFTINIALLLVYVLCVPPFAAYLKFTVVISSQGHENSTASYFIDQVGQRAAVSFVDASKTVAWLYKNIPDSEPMTPEYNNYVELFNKDDKVRCAYAAYWTHTINTLNNFPSHWYRRDGQRVSAKVGSFIDFNRYEMHKDQPVIIDSKEYDFYHSNAKCSSSYCEEYYTVKDSDIPFRAISVKTHAGSEQALQFDFFDVSVPLKRDFPPPSPQQWYRECLDMNLGLIHQPALNKYVVTEKQNRYIIWFRLTTPPHIVNGSSTTVIDFEPKVEEGYDCKDCIRWSPLTLEFDSNSFDKIMPVMFFYQKEGKERIVPHLRDRKSVV